MRRAGQYQQVLLKVPMFQACSKRELTMVSRLAEDCRFESRDVLVREGDRGEEFFVIVDGKAEVSRGGRKVAVLGPGDFFGELALLDPAPRDATVTAVTPLEAVILGRRELTGLLAEVPSIARRLLVGMARRLREADNRVLR
jgi:CRP-like cAMP-binding protein